MTLTELANKYGTDKGTATEPRHGYTEIYEKYLSPVRESVERVLEIGIQYGASLRMWRDYFPKAHIVGIDCDEAWVDNWKANSLRPGPDERVEVIQANVCDAMFWRVNQLRAEPFDLIVDDGGHTSVMILEAFAGAWELLRPGGLYIIEDLHQVYKYEDWEENRSPRALQLLHRIVDGALNEGGRGQTGRRVSETADVEFVHCYKSLAIIKKRIKEL